MKEEFKGFMHYAGPPTISYALDAAVEIVALTYIAKIGERELAAAGLSLSRARAISLPPAPPPSSLSL